MKQPKVSIIMPVYNAMDTIKESFQSTIKQTLLDIEIICIDNNSNDNSVKIIKEIQKKDPRIKLFFEKEQGTGQARNKGLEEATGEFVFFLDPDDKIYDCDTLEKLYNLAKNNNVKIAGGSLFSFDKNTGREQVSEEKYYFKRDGVVLYKDYQFDWGFWRFVYDRKFLQSNSIRFPAYSRGQDIVFFVKAMVAAKKFYAIKDRVYWYNYSFSGAKHSSKTYIDYEKANLEVIQIAKNNNLKELEESAQNHRIPLVSVIIPVYNVEKYLSECLDSIINQTYPNLEIILVNDKTPDSSGRIADEYAHKDERIKVIHKPKNEGLNMARATGFKASTGDYITFVDSDDMLTKSCIDIAINALLRNKTDFVRFNILNYRDKKELSSKLVQPINQEIVLKNKKALYKTQFSGLSGMSFLMCVWGAIYPRDLVEKINWKQSNYRMYEDNIWTLRLLEGANTATYLSYIGYLYRYDDSITNVLSKSISGNSFNGKPVGYLEFADILIKEYWKYNKQYNINAKEQIEDFARRQWVYRLEQLILNNALELENNQEYLPEILRLLYQDCERLSLHNAHSQKRIDRLHLELDGFLSTKRSVKLLAGNIKRRVRRSLIR